VSADFARLITEVQQQERFARARTLAEAKELEQFVIDLREYLENAQDINDNGGPNDAMKLLTTLNQLWPEEP
jgi:hypothetical protein